jgi:two-component system uhpT operon response regulator UhpA
MSESIEIARSPSEVMAAVAVTEFDLVLLDISFRESAISGFDVLTALLALQPDRKVVLLSMYEDLTLQRWGQDLGAKGFLSKCCSSAELSESMRVVVADGSWFLAGARSPMSMTPRQAQIIRLLISGLSEKEAAEELGLAVRTVEYHLVNVKRTFGVRTTGQLLAISTELGIHLLPYGRSGRRHLFQP